MMDKQIPEFAIMGHPNEGKSSVVSTLSEDDRVKVSPTPGETIRCQIIPVMIDGKEIVRFVDTPGFQNPRKTLAWLKAYEGPTAQMVPAFIEAHQNDPTFRDECELFSPLARGAGIIYVADASRPIRRIDQAEMEILRMTGQPRMAIMNCKQGSEIYLGAWKNEFRKNFNATRVFNAHNATYAERLALLENLKSIDQDWQPSLEKVILAFRQDWEQRTVRSTEMIVEMLTRCLQHTVKQYYSDKPREKDVQQTLMARYRKEIEAIEHQTHQQIRKLFKHNIFNYDLPEQSILKEDLFARKTWQVLGLTRKQLAAAAAVGGGAIGVLLDTAMAGLTFGIFTAIGSVMGAGAAYFGGEQIARIRIVGLKLGGYQLTVGPNENLQFLYILIDRALIYYSHIINWAHGRRNYPSADQASVRKETDKMGFTSVWRKDEKNICTSFFKKIHSEDTTEIRKGKRELFEIIKQNLDRIAHSERKYGLIMK
jgi:hypothetical protein